MDLTLQTSNTLGAIGSLAKPAPKTRRRQSTETATGSQCISSSGSISSQVRVGVHSPSRTDEQGAIVEASDAALVELVLAGDQDAFAVLVEWRAIEPDRIANVLSDQLEFSVAATHRSAPSV